MEKLIFILPLLFFGCGDISDKDQENFPNIYSQENNEESNKEYIFIPTAPPQIIIPPTQQNPEPVSEPEVIEEPNNIEEPVTEPEPIIKSEVDNSFPKTAVPSMPILAF